MEGPAAKLMDELIKGGIIARCVGPIDFLTRAHFVMKADGVRARLVTDYSPALNPSLRKAEHGFTCARDIREGLSPTQGSTPCWTFPTHTSRSR